MALPTQSASDAPAGPSSPMGLHSDILGRPLTLESIIRQPTTQSRIREYVLANNIASDTDEDVTDLNPVQHLMDYAISHRYYSLADLRERARQEYQILAAAREQDPIYELAAQDLQHTFSQWTRHFVDTGIRMIQCWLTLLDLNIPNSSPLASGLTTEEWQLVTEVEHAFQSTPEALDEVLIASSDDVHLGRPLENSLVDDLLVLYNRTMTKFLSIHP